jgi:hypothetical protein
MGFEKTSSDHHVWNLLHFACGWAKLSHPAGRFIEESSQTTFAPMIPIIDRAGLENKQEFARTTVNLAKVPAAHLEFTGTVVDWHRAAFIGSQRC